MSRYVFISKYGTLLFGSILAYGFIGPLGVLVYILVWLDTLVIMNMLPAKTVGFELLTLAAIISGIALGPVGGFLFTMIVIPALIYGLYQLVYHYLLTEIMIIPNVDFLAMAIASVFAGILITFLPFFFAVLISLLFRYFVLAMINMNIRGSSIDYAYAFMNLLFSYFILVVIQGTGLI
jgi:hypothetical protein